MEYGGGWERGPTRVIHHPWYTTLGTPTMHRQAGPCNHAAQAQTKSVLWALKGVCVTL